MPDERTLFNGQPVIHFDSESDRRNFLKYAGIVGVGATLVAAGTRTPFASAQNAQGDIDILNYALTLEFLEANFYKQGVDAGILSGRELALVTPIRNHEQAHVSVLSSTITDLGGKPVKEPKLQFPGNTFKDKATFLKTASTLEELGVVAYQGQVTNIKSVDLLVAAGSIAGVESRHAAILADLTGGDPFPSPVEDNKPMSFVLQRAKPFIK